MIGKLVLNIYTINARLVPSSRPVRSVFSFYQVFTPEIHGTYFSILNESDTGVNETRDDPVINLQLGVLLSNF